MLFLRHFCYFKVRMNLDGDDSMDEKPNLLLVEDDPENQKVIRAILRKSYEVDICDSDVTFYEKIETKGYDIILMDISLRGSKDGLQLTTELRRNPNHSHIPVVVLTAHAFQRDKDNAYNSGVDLFLTKPVQSKYLLQSLKDTLDKKRIEK
jgi:CheY-like chemotaxis protein